MLCLCPDVVQIIKFISIYKGLCCPDIVQIIKFINMDVDSFFYVFYQKNKMDKNLPPKNALSRCKTSGNNRLRTIWTKWTKAYKSLSRFFFSDSKGLRTIWTKWTRIYIKAIFFSVRMRKINN